MSYLRCLFAYSGVFLSSSCVLCTQCCQCLWIVHLLIAPSVYTNVYVRYTPYLYPRNEVVGGYTGFTMSVRLSVRPSVRPSVDKSYVVR